MILKQADISTKKDGSSKKQLRYQADLSKGGNSMVPKLLFFSAVTDDGYASGQLASDTPSPWTLSAYISYMSYTYFSIYLMYN